MQHHMLSHLLRHEEKEVLQRRPIVYASPSAGIDGRISSTKSKEMRIWNGSWRGLTPINSFGSMTGHPVRPASCRLENRLPGEAG